MHMQTTTQTTPVDHGNGRASAGTPAPAAACKVEDIPYAEPDQASARTSPLAPARQVELVVAASFWKKIVGGVIVLVILAGLGTYVLGVQFPGLNGRAANERTAGDNNKDQSPALGISLVKDKPHTLEVPADVRTILGIRKGNQDLLAVADPPSAMRPLVLSGSTALDPTRLARIRARFAPCRVVQIGQVQESSPKTGQTEHRELRWGDRVSKGDILGVFYSVDVGSKKNDLLDALVQLDLDQRILDAAEKHPEAVSEVFMLTQIRAVQGDRNAINRALNNLEVWDIPQEEIDALHDEAKKIAADKNGWYKTREGRWVKGEKQKADPGKREENPWGKVTLRAPFDGVIVERNLHEKEMVVDNTVNLFQIADVNRLLVIANAPEDDLPTLEALNPEQRHWIIRTIGATSAAGLPGTIDEIGYLIDPNQHTAVIKGYVDNPGQHLRAGQYVSVTIQIPPPTGVVEIPIDALVDDGKQSLVFVQTDTAKSQYTMRRVQVTHRFDQKVFVRSTPIPKVEQLTAPEAEEGLLPKEPLRPGERVLQSGAGELKAALLNLESQPEKH
jgi:membrane fusion protein, heavy metal efflux system